MLPEQSPSSLPYQAPEQTPPPPEPPDPLVVAHALALFILGVMVGLMAVVSRVAHELQSTLLSRAQLAPFGTLREGRSSASTLPPMIADLGDGLVRWVAFGLVVSGIAIAAGVSLWFGHGKPEQPHERRWTRCAALITLMLLISAGAAFVVPSASTRLVLLIVPSAVALIGLVALVVMVVIYTLNAPP